MKKICFFGDSNTWGYEQQGLVYGRMDSRQVYPAVTEALLGSGWKVVSDGLNGREIAHTKLDYEFLGSVLEHNLPLSVFAVMLGTNDWLNQRRPNKERIGERLEQMLKFIQNYPGFQNSGGQILVIAPPTLSFARFPGEEGYDTTDGELNCQILTTARACGCLTADAGRLSLPTGPDGIHLLKEGHRLLGEYLADVLRTAEIKEIRDV